MSDIRQRLKQQRYTYLVLIVISHFTGIITTPCTDQTKMDNLNHVIPMCKGGGPMYNTRVVIDTWGTGGPDVYSCTCTVTLDRVVSPSTVTTVTIQEYPGVEPWPSCGSKLRITSTTSREFIETGCTLTPAYTAVNFGTADVMTLTLSRANINTPWQSGHCILVSSDVSYISDLVVTCLPPREGRTTQLTTETTTSTSTTQSSTTDLTVSTTSGGTTTPTPSKDTTTASQARETTTYTSPDCGSTTPPREECPQQQGYSLSAVLVPLAVTILLIIVSVVGHVIFYRRRHTLLKQPGDTTVGTTPQSSTYDSLDLSRVEAPNVYADTSDRQMYVNSADKF